ncbi:FAD-dependent monooxygenase [Kribbella sp. NPDC058245]|uniref:FAD-dependent monooxygenase n=1 Tax=Kribbella sp. NPDC058245 TaxID=3346399 RepID=UPI0036F15BAE
MRVLISGASVAGPVLAYWLDRYRFATTVVERTPALRHGLGGHAVDLFGHAADVVQQMGLLDEIVAARTMIEELTIERTGGRPVHVDLRRLYAGMSDQHVEILRGELTRILSAATAKATNYLFDDSITSLTDDGAGVDVTFEHAKPQRFDLVIGADGMHSNVRRLTFGPEESMRRHLGGYLAVYSTPDLGTGMVTHQSVNRLVATYGVRQTGQSRAAFMFRTAAELEYDYRDKTQQKRLLAREFHDYGWRVPQLLEHLEAADDFYFDAIAQITLDTWQRGRIGLVGDAGYCPAPAVGGGTSLAIATAYILAGELATNGPAGLRSYETKVRQMVDRSRAIGPKVMGSIIPGGPAALRLIPLAAAVVPRLPTPIQRFIWSQNAVGKALGSTPLPDYSRQLQGSGRAR